jgi:hypothetical protein
MEQVSYKIYQKSSNPRHISPLYSYTVNERGLWGFKGNVYEVNNEVYTDDQIRLLILEEFDKERRLFEKKLTTPRK